MKYLLDADSLMAMATAVAGVALFALASRLPSALPEWFARLVGVVAVVFSLFPLYVATEDWRPPTLLAVLCLLAFLLIHYVQTREHKE